MTVILGIDPGSRTTGYGVIQQQGKILHYLGSGAIRTATAKDFAGRLPLIYAGISAVIDQFSPRIVAVEQVFMARNVDTALKLGQARGVAIVAAINANLALFEYAARQIKQTVTGSGGADKCQVQHMVRLLLRLPSTPSVDAADALAAAITYSHRHAGSERYRQGSQWYCAPNPDSATTG